MSKGKSPDEILASLEAGNKPAAATINKEEVREDKAMQAIMKDITGDALFKFNEAPRTRVNINGFETLVALDVFKDSGDLTKAQRANALVKLLGEELYKNIKVAANCAGLDDEAAWLKQKLWELFQLDVFAAPGAEGPFDKTETPTSPINKAISDVLGKSNLGSLVSYAKGENIRVIDALRYGVLNYLEKVLETGF